jgi:hypothetical protein
VGVVPVKRPQREPHPRKKLRLEQHLRKKLQQQERHPRHPR